MVQRKNNFLTVLALVIKIRLKNSLLTFSIRTFDISCSSASHLHLLLHRHSICRGRISALLVQSLPDFELYGLLFSYKFMYVTDLYDPCDLLFSSLILEVCFSLSDDEIFLVRKEHRIL